MKTGTVFSDPVLEILVFPIVCSLQPSARAPYMDGRPIMANFFRLAGMKSVERGAYSVKRA